VAPLTRTTWGWPPPYVVARWVSRVAGGFALAGFFAPDSVGAKACTVLLMIFGETATAGAEKHLSPRIQALLEDRDRRAEIPHKEKP